jgi:Tol biopolymer transport system component
MDPAGGSEPVRVTTNPSLDDCPAWGEDGRSIFFRSNRGGQWNVWRIGLK